MDGALLFSYIASGATSLALPCTRVAVSTKLEQLTSQTLYFESLRNLYQYYDPNYALGLISEMYFPANINVSQSAHHGSSMGRAFISITAGKILIFIIFINF